VFFQIFFQSYAGIAEEIPFLFEYSDNNRTKTYSRLSAQKQLTKPFQIWYNKQKKAWAFCTDNMPIHRQDLTFSWHSLFAKGR
jgi:hypothetical protein